MFKICMVGCGEHASRVHGPSLRRYAGEEAGVELAACCDIDCAEAERFAAAFGFARCDTDYREMLRREKPDAAVVVVPVPLSCAIACDVMRMGVPLMLEKPPGANAEEARRLVQVQQETGVPHRVAFNRRYMPQLRKVEDLMRQCGRPPEYIHYTMYRVRRFEEDFSTTAVHAIDAVRYLAGADYAQADFSYRAIAGQKAVDIFMDARMENGCIARIDICPGAGLLAETLTVSADGSTFFAALPTGERWLLPAGVSRFEAGKRTEWTMEALGTGDTFYEAGGFYAEGATFFNELRAGNKECLMTDFASSVQPVEVSQYIARRDTAYRK